MREKFDVKRRSGFVVGGLLLLMSLAFIGSVQAGTSTNLTGEETYWLTYMREQEKLARDVYLVLYDKYGLTIFDNISKSEQTHMDAEIARLVERWPVVVDDVEKMDIGATLRTRALAQLGAGATR